MNTTNTKTTITNWCNLYKETT